MYVSDEICVSGGVDQVDLEALPHEGSECEREGHASGMFFRVEIGDGGAIFNRSETLDRAGAIEERLSKGGLAGTRVSDERDVADLVGWEHLHCESLHVVVERRSDATQTWAPCIWPRGSDGYDRGQPGWRNR